MADAIIILRADADQAEKELSDLGDSFGELGKDSAASAKKTENALNDIEKAAGDADGTMQAMGSNSRRWGSDINTAANVASASMNAMSLAFGLASSAIGAAEQSMETFFRQSEEGDEILIEVQRRTDELKGSFFRLLIGTNDVDEAFERLTRVLDFATGAADIFITAATSTADALYKFTVVGPLVSAAFSLMSASMITTREQAELTTVAVTDTADEMAGLVEAYASRSAEFMLRAAEDTERTLAEGAARLSLESMGLDASNIEANVAGLTEVLLGNEESWDLLNRAVRDSGRGLGHTTGVIVDAENAFHGLGSQGEAMSAALGVAGTEARSAREDIENLSRSADELETSFSAASGAVAADEETNIFGVFSAFLEGSEDGLAAVEGFFIRELEIHQAFLDAKAQMERDSAEEMKILQIANDDFESARLNDKAQDALDAEAAKKAAAIAGINAQRGFTEQSLQSISALIAGEEGAQESFLRLIGGKLIAEGSSAMFKGGIELAFGNPQGAAGIAAGLLAIGAGQSIISGAVPGAAEASAVSQGAAAPALSQPQQVDQSSSVEIINNFGIYTSRREVASAVNDAMEDAERFGYRK